MNRTLYKANIATRDAHPAPADGFAGIELQGRHYDERVAAGEALLNILPTVQDTQPVHIGSFRGFDVRSRSKPSASTSSRSRESLSTRTRTRGAT